MGPVTPGSWTAAVASINQLSGHDLLLLNVCGVLYYATILFTVVGIFQTSRRIYGIAFWTALVLFSVALAVFTVFIVVVGYPFSKVLYG